MPPARTPRVVSVFALEGRIAVRQGDLRHYANIAWQHDPRHDVILLTTPLGQGIAELRRDEKGARLATADGKTFEADDWEGLAARVLGSRLPLDDMPRWLAGTPPAIGSGWQVEYLDYQSPAPDALPTLIELRHEDIEVRLKVDEWTATP